MEEEGRRDGPCFSAEGTADGSGLAGTMPLPPSSTPNYTYSNQSGRSKDKGRVCKGLHQTHSGLLLLCARRDRKRKQECRQPHMQGHLDQGSLSSSTLEVVKSKTHLSQKISSIWGVTITQGPMRTRWRTQPLVPQRERDRLLWQSGSFYVILSESYCLLSMDGQCRGQLLKDGWE